MNVFVFVKCVFTRHDWTNSKKKRGYMTCKQCGARRKYR